MAATMAQCPLRTKAPLLTSQSSCNRRCVICRLYSLDPEILYASLQCRMGLTARVVELHIVEARKLRLGDKGEPIAASIFVGRPGFE
jgi:hypothetical protein